MRSAVHLGRTLLALSVLAASGAGCARQVTRLQPEQAIDLSGRWNDVDSRMVAEALIQQSFASGGQSWAVRFAQQHGGEVPTVVIGSLLNRSMEHIPIGTFVRDLERAYVNSGQVQVVASPTERGEIREERLDQQEHASADSRARMRMESGAHYMLQGEIQSIQDRERGKSVVFYQVDVSLVDLESNSKVWVGQHKIKKFIDRPRFGL